MAAAAMIPAVNTKLDRSNLSDYAAAETAVRGAASVRAALETVGAFDALTSTEAAKARAELDALPRSVDKDIRDALKGAFGRSAAAEIAWVDDPSIAVQVTEDAAGVTHIEIHAPTGMNL